MKKFVKCGTKYFIWIPYGEIIIGTKYKSCTVWFRNSKYRIKKPNFKFED